MLTGIMTLHSWVRHFGTHHFKEGRSHQSRSSVDQEREGGHPAGATDTGLGKLPWYTWGWGGGATEEDWMPQNNCEITNRVRHKRARQAKVKIRDWASPDEPLPLANSRGEHTVKIENSPPPTSNKRTPVGYLGLEFWTPEGYTLF